MSMVALRCMVPPKLLPTSFVSCSKLQALHLRTSVDVVSAFRVTGSVGFWLQVQLFNSSHLTLRDCFAGEEARSAALQVTTARLTATNRLLKEVAVIQRCAEQLCPGQHPISDVISEFSLDEPECSHAGHAEQDSAFSRHPSLEQMDSTAQAEAVAALLTAPLTAPPVELATDEILMPGSSSTAQAWLPHASLAAADSDRVTDARVAPQASTDSPLPAAAPQLGSDRQAVAAQESPLPGMMSELQQAMAASFFSNGEPLP